MFRISLYVVIGFSGVFLPTSSLISQENPHVQLAYECETCHNESNWQTVRFNHQETGFELDGHHAFPECRDCHTIKDFSQINRQCVSCHSDIHLGRLSNDCSQCHQPSGWTVLDARTAHANTTFQLIGAHAGLDCASCHRNETRNAFLKLSSNCIDCHRTDFQNVREPDHRGLGFGRRCEDCHSVFAWQPAFFTDHNARFPIFSGTHAGEWQSCQTCHIVPGNYQEFSCLGCHEHRQSEMDDEHREKSGYAYNSAACYSCHPRGSEE